MKKGCTGECLTPKEKRELMGRYVTNQKVKHDIDYRLEQMASLEATLGIDSTKSEISKIRKKQDVLLKQIKDIDPVKYKSLAPLHIN